MKAGSSPAFRSCVNCGWHLGHCQRSPAERATGPAGLSPDGHWNACWPAPTAATNCRRTGGGAADDAQGPDEGDPVGVDDGGLRRPGDEVADDVAAFRITPLLGGVAPGAPAGRHRR